MRKSMIRRGDDVHMATVLLIVLLGILSFLEPMIVGAQQLTVDFYNETCPSAEQIVQDVITASFQSDPKIAAHLLRIQFHDCAATGCDASLLLTGSQSEQNAPPNLSLAGFDVINNMKTQLESQCPGIVSCADIITMAARDAVVLTGGPSFSVPLGRFDSTFSGGPNVNLPSPRSSVPAAIAFFNGMGLSTMGMVALLGAHTIGEAQCSSFSDRLVNFNGTGSPDPSLDPAFLSMLERNCSQTGTGSSADPTVPLDLGSEFVFDNNFYIEAMKHHGVLSIDQDLFTDPLTSDFVLQMADSQSLFFQSFVDAIINMGQTGVKDSTTGHIRAKCFA